jgi:hypothetical protein
MKTLLYVIILMALAGCYTPDGLKESYICHEFSKRKACEICKPRCWHCRDKEDYIDLLESELDVYVIHDRVENDYWNGKTWGQLEDAKQMPRWAARKEIKAMRKREAGGYADVGPEEDRPIVAVPLNP